MLEIDTLVSPNALDSVGTEAEVLMVSDEKLISAELVNSVVGNDSGKSDKEASTKEDSVVYEEETSKESGK